VRKFIGMARGAGKGVRKFIGMDARLWLTLLLKNYQRKERNMYSKLIILAIAVIGMMVCIVPSQSYALCDQGNARIVMAESIPFNNANATSVRFYVAPSSILPSFYYTFQTSNQMFINFLNTAHATNKQVRVTGNAAACPAAGALRFGGIIVAVFENTFY
jgi:hypothetical protein